MNIVHPNPTVDNPNRAIVVSDIHPGQDDVIATFTVKIGSVLVRRVQLRRGRNDAVYINYPSYKNEFGRWVHLVEIITPSLEEGVNEAIYAAVSEVMR